MVEVELANCKRHEDVNLRDLTGTATYGGIGIIQYHVAGVHKSHVAAGESGRPDYFLVRESKVQTCKLDSYVCNG